MAMPISSYKRTSNFLPPS